MVVAALCLLANFFQAAWLPEDGTGSDISSALGGLLALAEIGCFIVGLVYVALGLLKD
ncbi:MAG: hypothetical protein JWP74_1768 [Marmoricola sp.]|nr:hypothetical protein [Marmoricola sp.]